MKRDFFKSCMKDGETAACYLRRLEAVRAQEGFSTEMCVLSFLPRLPKPFLRAVETIRMTRASYGAEEVTWELLFQAARDELSRASIADLAGDAV